MTETKTDIALKEKKTKGASKKKKNIKKMLSSSIKYFIETIRFLKAS